ncbi:M23 family metallopeptidase [Microbacterium sp. Mu-80]|uniref:M23 family metallopeptidase n=1 Tax=Microbacterium bandirmense TaxID=3122050 RepID=A0ABU8LA79_9MICO
MVPRPSAIPVPTRGGRRHRIVTAAATSLLLTLVLNGTSPAVAVPADSPTAVPGLGATPAVHEAPGSDAPGYPWAWPVNGARRVVAPFRAPAHEYGPGHRGMDIASAPGAEVRAPADGVVAFRGTVVDRPLLTIDHGGGYVTTWEPVISSLVAGGVVTAGEVIGTVAAGGHSVRGAMHVGVRMDGAYINPRPLFGEVPRAVLLPCCE